MFIFLSIINFLLLAGSGFFIYKNSGLGFDLRTVMNTFQAGRLENPIWNFIIIITLLTYLLLAMNLIIDLNYFFKAFQKKYLIKYWSSIVSLFVIVIIFLTYLITINFSYCFPDSFSKLFRTCKTGYQDQIKYFSDFSSYANVQNNQSDNNFDPNRIIWKTYTSPILKISFEYPSELLLGEDFSQNLNSSYYQKVYLGNQSDQVSIPTNDGIYAPFEVDFYSNNKLIEYATIKTLNEARNEFKKGIIGSFTQKTFVTKDILVDNKSAVYYAGVYDPYLAMDDKYHWTIYIETDNGVYLIKNNFIIRDQYFSNDVLNKLISSFKFME